MDLMSASNPVSASVNGEGDGNGHHEMVEKEMEDAVATTPTDATVTDTSSSGKRTSRKRGRPVGSTGTRSSASSSSSSSSRKSSKPRFRGHLAVIQPNRLVWVKVKACPWWPCVIDDETLAPESVTKEGEKVKKRGQAILVRYLGMESQSYGWPLNDAQSIMPFRNPQFDTFAQNKSIKKALKEALEFEQAHPAENVQQPLETITAVDEAKEEEEKQAAKRRKTSTKQSKQLHTKRRGRPSHLTKSGERVYDVSFTESRFFHLLKNAQHHLNKYVNEHPDEHLSRAAMESNLFSFSFTELQIRFLLAILKSEIPKKRKSRKGKKKENEKNKSLKKDDEETASEKENDEHMDKDTSKEDNNEMKVVSETESESEEEEDDDDDDEEEDDNEHIDVSDILNGGNESKESKPIPTSTTPATSSSSSSSSSSPAIKSEKKKKAKNASVTSKPKAKNKKQNSEEFTDSDDDKPLAASNGHADDD